MRLSFDTLRKADIVSLSRLAFSILRENRLPTKDRVKLNTVIYRYCSSDAEKKQALIAAIMRAEKVLERNNK